MTKRLTGDVTDTPQFRVDHARFLEAYGTRDELAEVLLKGHLLVEEAVVKALEASTQHPRYIEELRLTFNHKIGILRALSPKPNHHVWEVVAALNTLRNALAHELDHVTRPQKLRRLGEALMLASQLQEKDTIGDVATVLLSAAYCHAYFSGLRAGISDRKKASKKRRLKSHKASSGRPGRAG